MNFYLTVVLLEPPAACRCLSSELARSAEFNKFGPSDFPNSSAFHPTLLHFVPVDGFQPRTKRRRNGKCFFADPIWWGFIDDFRRRSPFLPPIPPPSVRWRQTAQEWAKIGGGMASVESSIPPTTVPGANTSTWALVGDGGLGTKPLAVFPIHATVFPEPNPSCRC